MELSAEQLIYVGVVASVIMQALRLLANHFEYKPSRVVVNVVLFVISIGLGIAFFGLPEVASDDPMELASALIASAAAVLGSASLIYNVLLEKVLRQAK